MDGLYLTHYASKYYDPAKAREYYLKNRKLKGRSTGGMSEGQKEAWAYSKEQISTDKKSMIDESDDAKTKQIEALRSEAEETRQRISQKLKLLSEQLSKESKDKREDISEDVKTKIDALPPIPKNLSAEQKAKLMEDRKKEIADIRGNASKAREDVSEDISKERASSREQANSHREVIRTQLKASIQMIKDDFKKKKEEIVKKYEAEYDTEYDNVMKNIASKPKKAKKAKKGKIPKKSSVAYVTPKK